MTNNQKDQLKGTIFFALVIGLPLAFFLGPLPLIGILFFGFLGLRKK